MGDFERALRHAGKGFVLGVASSHWFGSWRRPEPLGGTAEEIAKDIPPEDWPRLSASDGTKGHGRFGEERIKPQQKTHTKEKNCNCNAR